MLQNYNKWVVFTQFAQCPTKNFHLRELERLTSIAIPSITKYVQELLKEKIIIKDITTLYPTYKANRLQEKFTFYKKMYNLLQLREHDIISFLEKEFSPDCIILFGSYQKGEDIETSDIDLFLQAPARKVSVTSLEKKLKRKIQLHCEESLQDLPPELSNNIMDGVTLSGFARWMD